MVQSLKDLWANYKTLESENAPREKLRELEKEMYDLETQLHYDHYNFDNRWERNHPPGEDKKPEYNTKDDKVNIPQNPQTGTNEFTESAAEMLIPVEEFKSWIPYFDKALAIKKLGVKYVEGKDPSLKGNPAGIGQVINMGFFLKLGDDKK